MLRIDNFNHSIYKKSFARSLLSIFLVVLMCLLFAITGCTEKDTSSYQVTPNGLITQKAGYQMEITAYQPGAFEVTINSTEEPGFPSFAKAESVQQASVSVVELTPNQLKVEYESLKAVVHLDNWQIDYFYADKPLTSQKQFTFADRKRGFNFSLQEGEKIIGGGQRILGMDRRGHKMPLYNKAHYGYTTESNQMYYGLPAVMSSKKYTLVFDNSATGELDIGNTQPDTLQFSAVDGRNGYLIFANDTFPKLINDYVELTGKQPMPALWTLGNYSSRFGYRTQQEVLSVIKKFEQEDFPVDSVIIDLYWFGKDIKGHMGNLAWDKEAFPDPETMIETLKSKGIKTILITEPFVLSSSKRWQEAVDKKICAKDGSGEPMRFDFYFGNTCLIDVFDDRARVWFWDIYRGLFEQGVAGTWGDLGEPEVHPDDSLHVLSDTNDKQVRGDAIHNAYGHEWAKLVYTKQRALQPNSRPLIMMRSGFVGSQRYGMIPWTGDVSRSWGGLQSQVELALQMSLFGLAYTHSDLGGFAGGENFDKELFIRWLQYGVFQPIYRPHAQEHIAPEPIFHDQETIDITREFVKLRYQLLPYLYTMAFENSTTGMPLMRPLFFADESDLSLINRADGYFWGEAFYVQPIVNAGFGDQQVNLPKGKWIDFWDGQVYQGDMPVNKTYPLNRIPVFVKAGAFIPMIKPFNNTRDYSTESFTLHYYADKSVTQSKGNLFDDDGESFGTIEKQQYELMSFVANRKDNQLTIDFSKTGRGFEQAPEQRNIQMVIHNWQHYPERVSFSGEPITFSYSPETSQLVINIEWQGQARQLIIK